MPPVITLPLGHEKPSVSFVEISFSCTRNIEDSTSKTKHTAITIYVTDCIVRVNDAFLIYYLTAVNSHLPFEIGDYRCTKLLNKT